MVAVSPVGSTPGQQALSASNAKRNADSVLRSLTNMNLPASRVRTSSTTSPAVAGGEVQVWRTEGGVTDWALEASLPLAG